MHNRSDHPISIEVVLHKPHRVWGGIFGPDRIFKTYSGSINGSVELLAMESPREIDFIRYGDIGSAKCILSARKLKSLTHRDANFYHIELPPCDGDTHPTPKITSD